MPRNLESVFVCCLAAVCFRGSSVQNFWRILPARTRKIYGCDSGLRSRAQPEDNLPCPQSRPGARRLQLQHMQSPVPNTRSAARPRPPPLCSALPRPAPARGPSLARDAAICCKMTRRPRPLAFAGPPAASVPASVSQASVAGLFLGCKASPRSRGPCRGRRQPPPARTAPSLSLHQSNTSECQKQNPHAGQTAKKTEASRAPVLSTAQLFQQLVCCPAATEQ